MPSIVFWEYVLGGTAHYRCRTPGGALARLGWNVSYVDDFGSSLAADVVVLQRVIADWVPDTIRALKKANPQTLVVYDIDDWFDAIPDYNPASKYVAKPETALTYCHEAMALADLITVTTPGLARLYGRFGPTAVLPNYLDPSWAEVTKPDHDILRIGWLAAYKWRGGDMEMLRPWLAGFLADHPDLRFGALGCPELLDDLGIKGFSLPMRPYADLPQMLANIDVGIVPLTFNAFNWQGKSWIKAMEYGALGIPAVCSPSEANRSYIRPGLNGQLVRKNDWAARLKMVMADLDRYSRGARKVAEEFFIDDHIGKWVGAYGCARRDLGSAGGPLPHPLSGSARAQDRLPV